MARPDFISPDFVEDSDSEQIQERMMENLPEDISDMEGDFPYDFTMPTAIEISQLIQFDITRAIMIAFPEYSWDDWLDKHGARAHVTRRAATSATGTLQVTADPGTSLPAGTIFAVPATDTTDAIEFQITEDADFTDGGTLDLPIEAVEAGADGNVAKNTIVIMVTPVDGVTDITNAEATVGGTDVEDDDTYYERIHAAYEEQLSFVGNDTDYINWAKEVDGVGTVIVDTDSGPGVVRLIIVDSEGNPATEALTTAVYNHIISPNDRSKRIMASGSAQLIVDPATSKEISFKATGLVLNNITLEGVKTAFETAVKEAYTSAKTDDILRYNACRTAFSSIEGVTDFEDFTMEGGHSNITLDAAEYPKTGTVDFEEA